MLSAFHAIILGLVEGVTEFLPVSSTGHLVLASALLHISQSEFVKTFEIAIQLGAIAAVVILYWRSLLFDKEIVKRIAVAFIPTGVLGLILYKHIKQLLESNAVVLSALAIGGLVLIAFEHWYKSDVGRIIDIKRLSYRNSFLIGLCQSISMIPGVSRSGATILGGMGVRLSRAAAVEFSFLLAVPTMCAATGLDLIKHADEFSRDQFGVLAIGFAVSFITAYASIRFLLGYVRRHTFIPFGIYRIVIAALLSLAVL